MGRTVQSGRVSEEKGVEQTAQVKVAVHYELQSMEFVEATVLSNMMQVRCTIPRQYASITYHQGSVQSSKSQFRQTALRLL